MAGHSKFANIKHRKGAKDAKRGKLFTKLIREITVAARMGGEEPANNPRLRDAIDKALKGNMTKDTILRAIKKGVGDTEGKALEEVRYEGYTAQGVAVLVDCLTDNRNRTVAEVRHAFNKFGGSLGTEGSVAYLFTRTGVVLFTPGSDEERIMEVALEAGAKDIVVNDDQSIEVLTDFSSFHPVKDALTRAELLCEASEIMEIAELEIEIKDQEVALNIMKLVDFIDDLDDVQDVYINAAIDPTMLDGSQ